MPFGRYVCLALVAGAAASLSIDGACAAQDLDCQKLRPVLLKGGQVIEL